MITICIPIFNEDVNILVDEIVKQCLEEKIVFQVLCFDDKSTPKYKKLNAYLGMKVNVNYTELRENHGRARIRNKMAAMARYPNLVFIDCDSLIQEGFIRNYTACLHKYDVVYGGRRYHKAKAPKNYRLHWLYGTAVESKSLKERLRTPYESFLSNNFMTTSFFVKYHPFDESIRSYGYEDLEWAERLKSKGRIIHHIDNEVIHNKLDTNLRFLEKTRLALQNLKVLQEKNLVRETRLLATYEKLSKFGLKRLLPLLNKWVGHRLEDRLRRGEAGVNAFQLYKLLIFGEIMRD